MVNRPPTKPGATGNHDASDGAISPGKRTFRPRRDLEWSLRSMHKIDSSAQHFLSNYYGEDDDSAMIREEMHMEDQTAYEIFKSTGADKGGMHSSIHGDSVWASLNAPLRVGIVDGKKVVFELRTNVTQKPKTSRKERINRKFEIIGSQRSGWEFRIRFYLMHFTIGTLSALYLAVFIVVNVIYAGLFYAFDEKCCGDPDLSFGDNFAFAIQTSATIGYGTMSPIGMWSNFLVCCLSYASILINTLFAGLLFTKFVTPVINIQFSDVMTMCNVNGVPCLSFRIGNADGHENPLTDINVRLTYSYQIPYQDHKGDKKFFRQTEELRLLSSRQHGLLEAWTLRHVLDESSPLFGLNFEEHPANKIFVFTLSVDAVQELTKSTVNNQTDYGIDDILIGHSFKSDVFYDPVSRVATSDYSTFNETEPYPVWYPAKTGAYDTGNLIPRR